MNQISKLSSRTLGILKNFADINASVVGSKSQYDGFVVQPGNMISILPQHKKFAAIAQLDETFEVGWSISDMHRLLSVINLFKDPQIDFGSKSLKVFQGDESLELVYTAPSNIHCPTDTISNDAKIMTDPVLGFELAWDELKRIKSAASILEHEYVGLHFDGEESITIQTRGERNRPVDNAYKQKRKAVAVKGQRPLSAKFHSPT
jgi:hypothetical protein